MKKLLLIATLFLLCSCATKYVTVPEYHTEYRTNTVHDSVYVEKHDSVIIKTKGDTVTVEHWKVRYRDKLIEVTDTFIKTDSIPVPYPVPAQLTKWQSFCCDYGKVMLGLSLAFMIGLIIVIIYWVKH